MRNDPGTAPPPSLRRVRTAELDAVETAAIRELMVRAFGTDPDEAFTADDWAHAIGGVHFVVDLAGEVVAHASVVERDLHVDGVALRTGYVEAVATSPANQGTGLGSLVMSAVNAHIEAGFQLGALGTGRQTFYERLGWLRWAGPSYVRTPGGLERTPEDDAYLMVLRTASSPPFELASSISCDWRPGDVW